MAKIVVSAFDSQQKAAHLLDSAIANGFDSRCLFIINPVEVGGSPVRSLMPSLPSIQARLYQRHLQTGDFLLVARVAESEVASLIKLLQSTGGHHIEAFDQLNAA